MMNENKGRAWRAAAVVLTVAGLAASLFAAVAAVMAGGAWNILGAVFAVLAFAGVTVYGCTGYRRGGAWFVGTALCFAAAVLVNVMAPGRTPWQVLLLAVLLATVLIYVSEHDDRAFAPWVLIAMAAFAIAYAIYTVTVLSAEDALQYAALLVRAWLPAVLAALYVPVQILRAARTPAKENEA